jgi:carbon storage regulator
MLVLSRKKQEVIRIGDNIEVLVIEVGRNRVRLGFRCPGDVSIARAELPQNAEFGQRSTESKPETVAELVLA